ncbi:hypothetical protein OG225_26025 [Nocardia sp. NBC_01377]|uniref:hypothetical protein n=1 Tax=Nocardia sp. NBC_01377 TaxID=2903595 RepID=UPI00325638E5
MGLPEIGDVVGSYDGLSRTVLDYSLVMKRLVDSAKQPGFTVDSWAPLAELVAVEEFDRVGPFKEVMDWSGYVAFLTNWAMSSDWEGSFKRITETSGLVFLELEERSTVGAFSSVVNSLSVYEFTGDGKIRHIDVYLQMTLPEQGLLEGYDGVEISQ